MAYCTIDDLKEKISEDGPPVLTIRSKDDGYITPRGIA